MGGFLESQAYLTENEYAEGTTETPNTKEMLHDRARDVWIGVDLQRVDRWTFKSCWGFKE